MISFETFGHQPPNLFADIWEDYCELLATYPEAAASPKNPHGSQLLGSARRVAVFNAMRSSKERVLLVPRMKSCSACSS